jgi:hypothetical protein
MPQELSNGVSIRGAQMGRRNNVTEPDANIKFHLVRLHWGCDGAYDQGGAYWGCGDPIYHAWGMGEHEEQEMFIRAASRIQARCEVRQVFPNCRFYR